MTTVGELLDQLAAIARGDMGQHWPAEFASAGTVLHPASTEKLMEYWAHGEGAAKIQWAVPCAFCRCVDHLRKYYPRNPKGLCANLEVRATGHRPNVENSRVKHCPC